MQNGFIDQKHKQHLLFFIIWPLVASGISFLFHLNIFYSTLVFLVVPSIILSFLLPKMVKKILIFSTVATVPFSIVIDYIAHFTGQWKVLNNTFPWFLGYVAIEDVIWVVCFVYFATMFYEYFVDYSKKTAIWSRRMKVLTGFSWGLLVLFFIFYFTLPVVFNIPYFYLLAGLFFMVIPSIIELFKHPKLLPKFLMVVSYFFFFALIYELTALKLEQWIFPSTQYIGWVSIAGLGFPFEEMFFGFFFYAMITLVCYETFDDNQK